MSRPFCASSVPESLKVDLLLRILRGETHTRAGKALGLQPRHAKAIAQAAERSTLPAGVVARARFGAPRPGDPPSPPVLLDLGRVSRAGVLAPPLEVDPLDFWASVDRSAGPSGCWPWMSRRHEDGYGLWRTVTAMRITWGLVMGPIPPGLLVRHYVCNNPPCCNPAHLLLGTIADNAGDRTRARLRIERPDLFVSDGA